MKRGATRGGLSPTPITRGGTRNVPTPRAAASRAQRRPTSSSATTSTLDRSTPAQSPSPQTPSPLSSPVDTTPAAARASSIRRQLGIVLPPVVLFLLLAVLVACVCSLALLPALLGSFDAAPSDFTCSSLLFSSGNSSSNSSALPSSSSAAILFERRLLEALRKLDAKRQAPSSSSTTTAIRATLGGGVQQQGQQQSVAGPLPDSSVVALGQVQHRIARSLAHPLLRSQQQQQQQKIGQAALMDEVCGRLYDTDAALGVDFSYVTSLLGALSKQGGGGEEESTNEEENTKCNNTLRASFLFSGLSAQPAMLTCSLFHNSNSASHEYSVVTATTTAANILRHVATIDNINASRSLLADARFTTLVDTVNTFSVVQINASLSTTCSTAADGVSFFALELNGTLRTTSGFPVVVEYSLRIPTVHTTNSSSSSSSSSSSDYSGGTCALVSLARQDSLTPQLQAIINTGSAFMVADLATSGGDDNENGSFVPAHIRFAFSKCSAAEKAELNSFSRDIDCLTSLHGASPGSSFLNQRIRAKPLHAHSGTKSVVVYPSLAFSILLFTCLLVVAAVLVSSASHIGKGKGGDGIVDLQASSRMAPKWTTTSHQESGGVILLAGEEKDQLHHPHHRNGQQQQQQHRQRGRHSSSSRRSATKQSSSSRRSSLSGSSYPGSGTSSSASGDEMDGGARNAPSPGKHPVLLPPSHPTREGGKASSDVRASSSSAGSSNDNNLEEDDEFDAPERSTVANVDDRAISCAVTASDSSDVTVVSIRPRPGACAVHAHCVFFGHSESDGSSSGSPVGNKDANTGSDGNTNGHAQAWDTRQKILKQEQGKASTAAAAGSAQSYPADRKTATRQQDADPANRDPWECLEDVLRVLLCTLASQASTRGAASVAVTTEGAIIAVFKGPCHHITAFHYGLWCYRRLQRGTRHMERVRLLSDETTDHNSAVGSPAGGKKGASAAGVHRFSTKSSPISGASSTGGGSVGGAEVTKSGGHHSHFQHHHGHHLDDDHDHEKKRPSAVEIREHKLKAEEHFCADSASSDGDQKPTGEEEDQEDYEGPLEQQVSQSIGAAMDQQEDGGGKTTTTTTATTTDQESTNRLQQQQQQQQYPAQQHRASLPAMRYIPPSLPPTNRGDAVSAAAGCDEFELESLIAKHQQQEQQPQVSIQKQDPQHKVTTPQVDVLSNFTDESSIFSPQSLPRVVSDTENTTPTLQQQQQQQQQGEWVDAAELVSTNQDQNFSICICSVQSAVAAAAAIAASYPQPSSPSSPVSLAPPQTLLSLSKMVEFQHGVDVQTWSHCGVAASIATALHSLHSLLGFPSMLLTEDVAQVVETYQTDTAKWDELLGTGSGRKLRSLDPWNVVLAPIDCVSIVPADTSPPQQQQHEQQQPTPLDNSSSQRYIKIYECSATLQHFSSWREATRQRSRQQSLRVPTPTAGSPIISAFAAQPQTQTQSAASTSFVEHRLVYQTLSVALQLMSIGQHAEAAVSLKRYALSLDSNSSSNISKDSPISHSQLQQQQQQQQRKTVRMARHILRLLRIAEYEAERAKLLSKHLIAEQPNTHVASTSPIVPVGRSAIKRVGVKVLFAHADDNAGAKAKIAATPISTSAAPAHAFPLELPNVNCAVAQLLWTWSESAATLYTPFPVHPRQRIVSLSTATPTTARSVVHVPKLLQPPQGIGEEPPMMQLLPTSPTVARAPEAVVYDHQNVLSISSAATAGTGSGSAPSRSKGEHSDDGGIVSSSITPGGGGRLGDFGSFTAYPMILSTSVTSYLRESTTSHPGSGPRALKRVDSGELLQFLNVVVDTQKRKREEAEARAQKAFEEQLKQNDDNEDGDDDNGVFGLFSCFIKIEDPAPQDENNPDEDGGGSGGAAAVDNHEPPKEFTDTDGNLWLRTDEVLGKGAFGSVYAGMSATGGLVAIKTVRVDIVDEASCKSLVRECSLLARLRHVNVVELLSAAVCGKFLMIVMENAGASLHGYLVQYGKLPEDWVRRYIRDTLAGLRYLHSKGIYHRDIKPHNILLSTDGRSKLADFGSAGYIAQSHTLQEGDLMGTIMYMSPEACVGEPNAPSDVWSVGIMAVQLVTGDLPWHAAEKAMPHSILNKLGKREPGFGPCLEEVVDRHRNPLLYDFCKQCLKMDPVERPLAGDLLQHPYLAT